jgi:hypothetical protein
VKKLNKMLRKLERKNWHRCGLDRWLMVGENDELWEINCGI